MEELGSWMRDIGDMMKLTYCFRAPNPELQFVSHNPQRKLRLQLFHRRPRLSAVDSSRFPSPLSPLHPRLPAQRTPQRPSGSRGPESYWCPRGRGRLLELSHPVWPGARSDCISENATALEIEYATLEIGRAHV